MGRVIKVTILDSGILQIVPQNAFSGENNAVQLNCYCSDALKDYTKYIDFESNGVKYRSPAFTDGLANFVFNIPNIISNYNTLFQFVFISGEQIIKTQKGTIYVQESVNAVDQITFESGDILDDFETRITLVEGKVDDIVQTISYDDLAELKSGDGLKAGKFYKIEYTTKHVIPNTEVINEGTLENLIILATSSNTFHNKAISIEYPKDEIDYDFDDNICEDDITTRTGWITRRKDTIYNNEVVGFDFKNAKFRRFTVDLVASGVSEWVYDDAHSKGDLVYNGTDIYVCIKNLVGNPDITETEFWLKICNTTDYICLDSTGLTKIYINETEVILKGNTTNFEDNYLFDYTNANNINNYVKCTVENNNTISGGDFSNNTISEDFYNNTISGGFYYNTISGGEFSYNTISQNFRYNQILTNVDTIDFTLSTFVYNNFNKTIGLNSLDVLYLSYIDGDNVQQFINITD
jgi:hypothetical protein